MSPIVYGKQRRKTIILSAHPVYIVNSFSQLSIRLINSFYICLLCVLLLQTTTSIILVGLFDQRFKDGGSGTFPLSMNGVSCTPIDAEKHNGLHNCLFAIHSDVARCNNSYHQSLSNIIMRGFLKASLKYRKQFCCGFWQRERCVTDSVRRKCTSATLELFQKAESPYANQVDTRQTPEMSCIGYEENSQICSASSRPRFWSRYLMIIYSLFVGCLLTFLL